MAADHEQRGSSSALRVRGLLYVCCGTEWESLFCRHTSTAAKGAFGSSTEDVLQEGELHHGFG